MVSINHNNKNNTFVNKSFSIEEFHSSKRSIFDYIALYLSFGFCLLPLADNLKHPLIKWKHYQNKPVTKQFLTHWFEKKGIRRIGVLCGSVSNNLLVVDCDHKSIANKFLKNAPKTLTTTTREGRKHFIYKTEYSRPTRHFRYFHGPTNTEMGVDLVSEKGIVVLPPTLHPKGHKYRIIRLMEPTTISVHKITKILAYCCSSLNLRKITKKKLVYSHSLGGVVVGGGE